MPAITYRPVARAPDGSKVIVDMEYAIENDFGAWEPVPTRPR